MILRRRLLLLIKQGCRLLFFSFVHGSIRFAFVIESNNLTRKMSLMEVTPEKSNVLLSPERLLLEVPQGLHHTMAIVMLIVWYVTSGATLFSNKYILSHLNGDAFSLGNSFIHSSRRFWNSSFVQVQINLSYLSLVVSFNSNSLLNSTVPYIEIRNSWKMYFVICYILVHIAVQLLF